MNLKEKRFINWFQKLGEAWVQKNPDAVIPLLADGFKYFETPFQKPYTSKKDILKLWQQVPETQKDISYSFDILSIQKDTAIAHWKASFIRLKNNQQAHLDGIFLIQLDKEGRCSLFRMWWNSKE